MTKNRFPPMRWRDQSLDKSENSIDCQRENRGWQSAGQNHSSIGECQAFYDGLA
jgi:hypothetical protein